MAAFQAPLCGNNTQKAIGHIREGHLFYGIKRIAALIRPAGRKLVCIGLARLLTRADWKLGAA